MMELDGHVTTLSDMQWLRNVTNITGMRPWQWEKKHNIVRTVKNTKMLDVLLFPEEQNDLDIAQKIEGRPNQKC